MNLDNLWATVRHNQGVMVAVLIVVGLVFWSYGCESTVKSLLTEQKVTRSELTTELSSEAKRLETEIDNLKATAAIRFQQLDSKDAIKAKIFDAVSVATTSGGFNVTGLLTLAGSFLGLGAIVDNRIKDKVIKNRPLPNSNPKRSTS